jgi:hypothetical protein
VTTTPKPHLCNSRLFLLATVVCGGLFSGLPGCENYRQETDRSSAAGDTQQVVDSQPHAGVRAAAVVPDLDGRPADEKQEKVAAEEKLLEWLPVLELRANDLSIDIGVLDFDNDGLEAIRKVVRRPVVCLSGAFPQMEQVEKLRAVLDPDSTVNADEVLSVVDFKLERQESRGLPASWDELPWHPHSQDQSIEVLGTVDDNDIDVIQPAEMSYVFTSPLPALDEGTWDERVSHPRLKENRLPAERDRAKVSGGAAKRQEVVRYLLFRYFDFTVTPGQAYRYRVKMVFEVPSKFGQDIEFLRNVQGGPWSEPSSVALLGADPD